MRGAVLRFLSLLSVLAFLCGCGDTYPPSEEFESDEIPGQYVATFREGLEYVELKADSTFVHFYSRSDSTWVTETGDWRVFERGPQGSSYEGYFSIELQPFTSTHEHLPSANPLIPPRWSDGRHRTVFTFKKLRGKMQIVIHPLRSLQYIKE